MHWWLWLVTAGFVLWGIVLAVRIVAQIRANRQIDRRLDALERRWQGKDDGRD